MRSANTSSRRCWSANTICSDGARSTLVGSQLPVEHRHEVTKDPTPAGAVHNRLVQRNARVRNPITDLLGPRKQQPPDPRIALAPRAA